LIHTYNSIITRKKITNFGKINLSTLSVCDKNFRQQINKLGVPYGKKSEIIEPPKAKYSEIDYWRGIIDGDGSLGITKNNLPFISLVTASQNLAEAYVLFLEKNIGYKKKLNKNKKDGVYNLMVTSQRPTFEDVGL
jgi:hypothetical protein